MDKEIKKIRKVNKGVTKEKVSNKEKELNELKERVEILENQLKSSLSDYQNLKRRIETEKENITDFKNSVILKEFLDIMDDIYLYIKHISGDNIKKEDIINGINVIYNKGSDVIKNQGIELQSVNIDDDYLFNEHEVIGTVIVDESKNNKVVDVVRNGYTQNGKVIRPARVIVGKIEQN